MKKRVFLLFLITIVLVSGKNPQKPIGSRVKTIVIDAGHGGKDPGCVYSGAKEKEITLSIALKLGKLIKDSLKDEVKVFYTRMGDSFIELNERSKIANRNNADVFISIHCNHAKNHSAHGTETYVMGTHKDEGNLEVAKRENEAILLEDDYMEAYEGFDPNSPEAHILFSLYQNTFRDQSLLLAASIENFFKKRKETNTSRGVKQAGFLVLWKTTMPSVLIETGFLSNTKERAYLNSGKGQNEVAESIFKAVLEYKSKIENLE